MKKVNWWQVLAEVIRIVIAAVAGGAGASAMM